MEKKRTLKLKTTGLQESYFKTPVGQRLMRIAQSASLNMQAQPKPQSKNGMRLQQNCPESTHQDFIMSRFLKIT